jgi:translation initiation factor 1
MSKSPIGGGKPAPGKPAPDKRAPDKRDAKRAPARHVVFSTDPEPVDAAPTQAALPANPAAPVRSRQLNTPVLVTLEKKGRGGKSVSVVKQVMSPPAGKEALLKLLKTKLGTGGTLKDDTIEIQGDRRDDIVTLLRELGYQAKRAGG